MIDNHSPDNSLAYLQPLFPWVCFFSNDANLGFAKANNRAWKQCRGEYVLFLNPDTLVPEDCLGHCLLHIRDHPEAGALGVHMLDGKGRFLPESKRSFPSPLASFYKLTGLAALFPRSAIFNRYALGNLNEKENHQVDVLAGAFLLTRKYLLETLNGFDESYFLYGEDIDLSYRIQRAGWQNHYFAGTQIIHFKGESSDRKKLDHVKFFYSAMLVFVQKHYKTGEANWFSWFIRIAITVRGILSGLRRITQPVLLPVIDGGLVWLSLVFMQKLWVSQLRHGLDFGVAFIPFALPVFALLFVFSAAFIGLYDTFYKNSRAVLSVAFAVIIMLALYSLLPETLRFSRGVILWGGVFAGGLILWLRQTFFFRKLGYEPEQTGQTLVVGSEEEYAEVSALLENALQEEKVLVRIDPEKIRNHSLDGLQDLVVFEKNNRLDEIIFCEGTMLLSEIIMLVQLFSKRNVRILFHMSGSNSITGSEGPALGKIIGPLAGYRIAQPYQQRMKRLIDITWALLFLVTAPLHLVLHENGAGLLRNACRVLTGKRGWIGYASAADRLPPVKKGIITHVETTSFMTDVLLEKSDRLYAKNYDWWKDVRMVFRQYFRLA